MKKDLGIIFGLFLLIILLVIFGKGMTTGSFITNNQETNQQELNGNTQVSVRNLVIDAKIARTPEERRKGLAGQSSLVLNQGMLFVFEKEELYPFWMKDMKFAIDIIWIDQNKKIVDIAPNVAAEPDLRERDLKIYRPDSTALYVLEVNAGLSALNNLQKGDEVRFEL